MSRKFAFLGVFMLAAGCVLIGVGAEDEEALIDAFTPENYDYTLPEEESPQGCLDCMHQSDYHLYRAVGLTEPENGEHAPTAFSNTGKGWLSSKHATATTKGLNDNTYCSWCHMPTNSKASSDNNSAKVIKAGSWHGMSCQGCHTTHSIAAVFGTRYTNLIPGADLEEQESYIPRHAENGKAANRQCLYCHGSYHGFDSRVKEALVDSGSLRCMDCHMPGYQLTTRGTVERYHNMKVVENLPRSCDGKYGALVSCHSRVTKKWGKYVVPKIFGSHTRPGGLPGLSSAHN